MRILLCHKSSDPAKEGQRLAPRHSLLQQSPELPVIARGRAFSAAEIEMIRALIAAGPQLSRLEISLTVCERLDWRQANGRLKDRACRVALLRLHERGVIELPPPRRRWQRRPASMPRQLVMDPRPLIEKALSQLGPIELVCVSRNQAVPSAEEGTWNELIDRYHFLGYRSIVGPQLKYLIVVAVGVLGCIGFGPAFAKIRARDEWIGWSADERQANLHQIINQVRLLVAPWVRVPNLASHVLAISARRVVVDWQKRYQVRPLLIETFVHPERHAGTCYRAANFSLVGSTGGYGKPRPSGRPRVTPKLVFLYPLSRHPQRDLRRWAAPRLGAPSDRRRG